MPYEIVAAAADPYSYGASASKAPPAVAQAAAKAGYDFASQDFWTRMFWLTATYAVVGAGAGYFGWGKPMAGAVTGAALGVWTNATFGAGAMVGYQKAEEKRLMLPAPTLSDAATADLQRVRARLRTAA